MAASASSGLERLYEEFGDRVAFVTLYVREAHPGERVPQHRSFEEKLARARDFQRRDAIPWPVAVDDLDGRVHQLLGRMPDAAYVIGLDGRVAGSVLWSNDRRGLRRLLRATVEGRAPRRARRYATLVPLLRGVGVMHQILSGAGPQARRDMWVTAPPVYGLARGAALFRPLSPLGRSIAALTTVLGGVLLVRSVLRKTRAAGSLRPARPTSVP
jgi:hypothetical protein